MKKENLVHICGKEYAMRKSKFTVNYSPVIVSDYMTGKMSGIPSISTSCLVNPICRARMADGDSICAHCFAAATLERYSAAGVNAESNFHLLNDLILPEELLPVFKDTVEIVRIESFGDVGSVNHAINYLNICKKNPHVRFAWWSKNMGIVERAVELVGKPENVVLVESSEKLNRAKERVREIVDKTFTVYDKKTIETEGIEINCGARCCLTCQRCYRKGTEADIAEQLK